MVARWLIGKLVAAVFAIVIALAAASPAAAQGAGAPPPNTSRAAAQCSGEKPEGGWPLECWEDSFTLPDACWGCLLVSKMVDVTFEVGKEGEKVFRDGAIAALPAFFGLWLMFQLLRMLSVSHANTPVQSINEIANGFFLALVLLAILKIGPFDYIMTKLVFPIISSTMAAAQSLIGGSADCGFSGSGQSAKLARSGSSLMCSMHVSMGKGIGLGMWLMDSAEWSLWPPTKIELLQWTGGLFLVLSFGMMMILLPFRLFDALIRLAVISIILPIIILAGQFKMTRGAVKQAVTATLAATLMFLFTAIAVAVSVRLIDAVTVDAFRQASSEAQDSLIGPLDGNSFMILIAASVGLAAFILQAGNLASEFAGFQGHMGNVGTAGAGAVGGAMVFAASKGGAVAGRALARATPVGREEAAQEAAQKAGGVFVPARQISPGGAGFSR